jgi:hypothetical protein
LDEAKRAAEAAIGYYNAVEPLSGAA